MALAQEDVEFIKAHLAEWLEQVAPRHQFEREVYERLIRVEEALVHQRELMRQGFAAMEKRFEQVEKRFEQVDKRFEEMNRRIDRFMIWSFGLTATATGLIIAVLRLWPPGS